MRYRNMDYTSAIPSSVSGGIQSECCEKESSTQNKWSNIMRGHKGAADSAQWRKICAGLHAHDSKTFVDHPTINQKDLGHAGVYHTKHIVRGCLRNSPPPPNHPNAWSQIQCREFWQECRRRAEKQAGLDPTCRDCEWVRSPYWS